LQEIDLPNFPACLKASIRSFECPKKQWAVPVPGVPGADQPRRWLFWMVTVRPLVHRHGIGRIASLVNPLERCSSVLSFNVESIRSEIKTWTKTDGRP
jgi:hypothetical protein